MTEKNSKIIRLKKIQKQKLKEIERLKKRMWKHLLLITVALGGFVLYCIDDAYLSFGGVKNFITLNVSILVVISLTYFFFVRFQKNKKIKEIKTIKVKLYNLMKLENG